MMTGFRTKGVSAKKKPNRKAAMWVASAVIGLVAFAAVWWLQYELVRRQAYQLVQLQGSVYDAGMTLAARKNLRKTGANGPVTIIAIKENTNGVLQNVASFLPGVDRRLNFGTDARAFHVRLLQRLKELGARTVVFDILFDADNPELDPHLAKAMQDHGNVILVAFEDKSQEAGGAADSRTLLYPNPTLMASAKGIGVANVPQDPDKTVRRFQWWYKGLDPDTVEETPFPPLGVAAAAAHAGKNPKTIITEEVQKGRILLGKPIAWLPGDDAPTSYFQYYGLSGFPAGADSLVNYEEVVALDQEQGGKEKLRRQIEGKIVIIGNSTIIAQDRHRTPVLSPQSSQGDDSSQDMYGVEIQAHIAQTALNGRYVRQAPDWARMLLTLASCLLIALLGRVLGPWQLLLAATLTFAALITGSITLLSEAGVTLEPVTACAGVLTAFAFESVFMHMAERKQRVAVKRQLNRHVGPGVADKLTEDEWPDLTGESWEITMLFSDLEGFTTLSESMSSQELCALLNRYCAVIFPIIDKYEGGVDKLMGDGMMAYFGWPKRTGAHAEQAIRCALEMQEALEQWQQQPEFAGQLQLRTRIGLHTGTAMIGEIGVGDRAEFTVIGDVVNVAARLESMNKDYGTTVLLSEATRNSAGEIVPMAYRGVAAVRGRKEPMPVYSVETASSVLRSARTGAASFNVSTSTQSRSATPVPAAPVSAVPVGSAGPATERPIADTGPSAERLTADTGPSTERQ